MTENEKRLSAEERKKKIRERYKGVDKDELPVMLIISQWWIRRSRIAVVIVASPRKSAHSSKPLLDVIISDVFSDMEDTNPKKRFASVGVSGMKPTSSIITRAALCRYFILRLLALEISTVFRIIIRLSSVSKATV